MRRLHLSARIAVAAGAFALTGVAQADTPPPPPTTPTPTPTPTPAPAPAPAQPGRARIDVVGAQLLHGRAYVLRGQRVTLRGTVKPYVPGQALTVRVASPHRKAQVVHARIGKGGIFKVVFRARRAVRYTVFAQHARTDQQVRFSTRKSVQAINTDGAGPGSHGVAIVLLKQGLRALGYPAGKGPYWTGKLGREVMAFRKVNGMARVFTANHAVFSMVLSGRGTFKLRHPDAGKHAEFDWSRQVLALYDGKTLRVYHASSGKPSTPTVFGEYHFYLKAPGTNAKGMFMSNYFVRGYAVHGYPDVPAYAASHGCIRVPNPDALEIWAQISVGEPIYIYV